MTKRTCSVDGCAAPVYAHGWCNRCWQARRSVPECSIGTCPKRVRARGWCGAHYRNWLKYGDPEGKAPPRPSSITDGKQQCSKCGEIKSVEDFPRRGPNGPYRKDCKGCIAARTVGWVATNRESLKARSRGYRETNSDRIRAQRKAAYEANAERNRARSRIYREQNRRTVDARNAAWRKANPERARLIQERCQMKRRAAWVEDVDRAVVFVRHDGMCGICGKPVDPERFHVDHVIPLSRGGEHSYANVQLAHPRCNQRKNARLPEEFVLALAS